MTDQELMAFVKKSLRVASNTFDDEIQALINAGEADITQATDKAFDITDKVQCNAVAVYCQAYFGYGDDKALARYKDMLIQIGLRKINGTEE
jgi:hypothetical protein